MDTNIMKKLGWSQELIDAINDIKNILDKGSVKDKPLMNIELYNKEHFNSTTINATHYLPVGHNYISIKRE